jgi:hypothetical protein
MKFFFVFEDGFEKVPLAVALELRDRSPGFTLWGLVQMPREMFGPTVNGRELPVERLDFLPELERRWLATPCDDVRLAAYEEALGPGVVRRIIIADRDMSSGMVSGGLVPKTFLGAITKDDEMMRRYVFGLVDYLFETLKEYRPDLVFCGTVDNGPSWALSQVCRCLGIPFAAVAHTRVGRRYMVDDNPENLLEPVRRRFEHGLQNPASLEGTLAMAKEYLSQFRSRPASPPYLTDAIKWASGAKAFGDLLAKVPNLTLKKFLSWFREPISLRNQKKSDIVRLRITWNLQAWKLLRGGFFRKPGELPQRPFVYFPLHEEPEAALHVHSYMHTDQVSVIEALAKSLPIGMNLLIKDNPLRWGLRPFSFYERIRKIPTVEMAWPQESSISLVQQAALTAVISGTAAWEAMLLKRPALIICASPFMAVGQGFVHCPDLSRLPHVLPEALKIAPADDERLELYLAALFERSFEVYPPLFGFRSEDEIEIARNREVVVRMCEGLLDVYADFVKK